MITVINQRRTEFFSIKSICRILYVFLFSFLLIGHLYFLFWGIEINTIPVIFWIFRIVTSILAIWLGKLWKDKGFILLSLFLCYMFLRLWLIDNNLLFSEDAAESLISGIWMCGACYGCARILDKKELKRLLGICSAIWTIGVVIYGGIGIHSAWVGHSIVGPGGAWWNFYGRMIMIYLPTTSGNILSVSAIIALVGGICNRNTIGKLLYLMAFLVIIIAMGLTDSRTAFICTATGVGAISGLSIYRLFRTKVKNRVGFLVICLVSALCAAVLTLLGIRLLVYLFNLLKAKGGLLFTEAMAEGLKETKITVISRSFTNAEITQLSGRTEIWRTLLDYLFTHKTSLIFGNTIVQPMNLIPGLEECAHCHNLILQIIIENGLIGLSIVLCFLFYLATCCFRMITKSTEFNLLMVLPIIFSSLIGELVECNAWFRSSQCPMGVILFIAIGIACTYGKRNSGDEMKEMVLRIN